MNTHALAVIVACSVLFIASCRKPDRLHIPCPKDNSFVVRELQTPYTTYVFHYDQGGLVDSISGIHREGALTVMRVARHGKKIDSVSRVQDGVLVFTTKDIRYDDKGRITGYTFYVQDGFPPLPGAPVFITYGPDGNIATITYPLERDTFTFNQHNDLVRWRRLELPATYIVSTFTYDTGVNPLYCIDDLFVILNDGSFKEFMFSQHNSTGQVWEPQPPAFTQVTKFENKYDPSHRLTKKIFKHTIFVPGEDPFVSEDSLMYRY